MEVNSDKDDFLFSWIDYVVYRIYYDWFYM